MSKDIKVLRGQLRALVKEILTEEIVRAVEERLTKRMDARLDKIDQKQKDILGFTVRTTQLGAK